jgi:acetyl-CoA C-acetyltransferase
VITGGEAKFRDLRGAIQGWPPANTEQSEDTPPPDVHHTVVRPWPRTWKRAPGSPLRTSSSRSWNPALRHADGLDVERHRDRIAELYSRFSEVAVGNPHAWRRRR